MTDDHGSNQGSGENIDISALPSKDSPAAKNYSPEEAPESQRLSESVEHNVWRPFTLRAPTLLGFLFLTIGLIAITETLNYISIRNDALVLADVRGEFSMSQVFCYRYLPQMVIVLYGIGWAAVDLDVKRLEPYFQLSKPGGASASDSILLHYPFDFLALVPVTAAKRKHWNVFAAGMALVLIFWVITPLQSSLLTIELVKRETHAQFEPTERLRNYSYQTTEFTSEFLYPPYGVIWLGQEIDSFMTKEFVAIPFMLVDSISEIFYERNESWTSVTRIYQTHVDCAPATVIEPGESDGGVYNFTTDGCSYSLDPLPDMAATRNLVYIGYNNNSTAQRLRESECKVKNIFLGVWAKSRLSSTRSTDIDVSGIFCRTRYSYVSANITVNARNSNITGFSFIGEPKPLTAEDRIFNIDMFEQILGAGSTLDSIDSYEFPPVGPTTQARYEGWNLWEPTQQVGYAIGLENKTFDDFRDPKIFGDAMNKTHKLLFNYAVKSLFVGASEPNFNGTRVIWKNGVVVVPAVAHLLGGFLAAVAGCLAGVFFLSYNRPSNLRSDPDTLATKMSLVAQSPQLLRDFEGADNCPDIGGCIKRRRYKLWGGEESRRLDIIDDSDTAPSGSSHESSTKPHDGRGIRPWELSAGMGVGITIFSAGLLVLLALLYRSSQKYSGLPTLSNRQLVIQFIFSFVPTAVATLIEPLWVVVTRYLALYQPWAELNRGHSLSASSLGLKYTNLPPVLIAPRALAGSHYILSLASFVVLASNGLAVALGGLFDNGPRTVSTAMTFEFPLSASIDAQIQTNGIGRNATTNVTGTFAKDGEEHWLIAIANHTPTTSGPFINGPNARPLTPLPPWIAPGFYFLPFERNMTTGNAMDLRSANTWGFGLNLTCKLLAGDVYGQQSWVGLSGDPTPSPAIALNVTIPMANGNEVRCNNSLVSLKVKSLRTGLFAGEYLFGLGATDRDDKEAEEFCNSFLVMGWNRGSVTVGGNSSHPSYAIDKNTSQNTTILCAQQISSAEFKVVVNNDGVVQRFKRLTPFAYDNSSLFNHSTTITSFKAQLATIIRTNPSSGKDSGAIHSSNIPRSLPHVFIDSEEDEYESNLCDPELPPPSFELAQRRFQRLCGWLTAIVVGQNSNRIFRSTTQDGGRRPQVSGQLFSLRNRVSMDPVMFYIAIVLLGFSTLASAVVFTARPKRFLPRLPDCLAAEIGLFYASEALEDIAGTAHMSSAMRERHLAAQGLEYGYGQFMGKDGKVHSGIQRMGPINDFKEAS